MSYPSAERLLTLHGVRLSGLAQADGVAGRYALDTAAVSRTLTDAEAEGLAHHKTGVMTGWWLTPEGRRAASRLLADELDAAGVRPVVEAAYRRFRSHHRELVRLRDDWEWLDRHSARRNHHRDPVRDTALIDGLVVLHGAATPVWTDLAGVLDRFRPYGRRFETALAHLRAGRFDWFTQPLIDSYHTVWFELHEDLLATLGIERSKEDMF